MIQIGYQVLDSLCCLDALLSLKGKLLCNLKGREVMS
jgi:hypothetical protein